MPVPLTSVNHPDFLSSGFDQLAAQTCEQHLFVCRRQSPENQPVCMHRVVHQYTSCKQLIALSEYLQVTPLQLKSVPFGKLISLSVTYPADGQISYYLITPKGALINTAMNPRTLPLADLPVELQQDSHPKQWLLFNHGKPCFYQFSGNLYEIFYPVRISQNCRACERIADSIEDYRLNLATPEGESMKLSFHKLKQQSAHCRVIN